MHHGCRVGGEFADNFFKNVFDRHQALNIAVLIDHECHAALVALKIQQLHVERRSGRYEVRLARLGRRGQCLHVKVPARQFVHDLFHVQKADDAINFALIYGQSGVLALAQLLHDPVPIVIDVDADDFIPRDHDVFDRGILEIQNADQHLLVAPRNHGAGLGHNRAQLFAAQGVCRHLPRHTEHAQYAIGEQVREPNERVEYEEQGRVDEGRRQCQAFGMQCPICLRRDLAKYQQHKGQQCGAEGHQEFTAHF